MAYNYEYPYVDPNRYNSDWLLSKMKEVLLAWEEQKVEFKSLKDAWKAMQDWINAYFDNLDVQEEINEKLNGLVEDGTMYDILLPLVNSSFNPTFVDSVSDMTNKNKTYVLKSNAHIYTYTNSWGDTGVVYGQEATSISSASAIYSTIKTSFIQINEEEKTITIPSGYVTVDGKPYAVSSDQTIDLDYSERTNADETVTRLYTAQNIFFDMATKKFYTVYWSKINPLSDPCIGHVYGFIPYINGYHDVNKEQAIYSCPTESDTIRINPDTQILNINTGWATVGHNVYPIPKQDVEIVDTQACTIYLDCANRKLYTLKWSIYNSKNEDPVIGHTYGNTVYINGIDKTRCTNGFLSLTEGAVVKFNNSNSTIEIPGGNVYFNGTGYSIASQTVDLSGLSSTANYLFYNTDTKKVFAMHWLDKQAEFYPCIGTRWANKLYINGVKDNRIINGDISIAFFGDSITAGVGTTTAYHMYLSKYLGVRCKNYGVGTTGYVKTTTENVRYGDGVEGIGTNRKGDGHNSIIEIMQATEFNKCSIAAGVNDYTFSVPLDSFRTAVQNTLNYALSVTAYVTVLTPLVKLNDQNLNNVGAKLIDYVNIIKEECESRFIPYSEGFKTGLNANNALNKSTFYADTVHPNAKGHARIADTYENVIKGLVKGEPLTY